MQRFAAAPIGYVAESKPMFEAEVVPKEIPTRNFFEEMPEETKGEPEINDTY